MFREAVELFQKLLAQNINYKIYRLTISIWTKMILIILEA